MPPRDLLEDLNSRQRAAATLPDGHALVLAGAGTGKTRTIVARAAHLITSGTDPRRIQILSFTRKSAQEIVERIRLLLGGGLENLRASTFHSWCINLIRSAPQAFGCKGFSVIDRDDSLEIMKMSRSRLEEKRLSAKALLDLYSFCRNTLKNLTTGLLEKHPELKAARQDIAEVLKSYEAKKRDTRYLDYDDILEIVARQMGKVEEVRRWISANNKHILIDEFQDTNPLQWELIRPLATSSVLFCVGDDAQSIYGFRGADFKNIHHFAERVENPTVVRLEENYRSTQEILDLSNWLLACSPLRYEKQLVGVRGPGLKPEICSFQNEFAEGRWIAEDLKARRTKGAPWRDHMILVRSSFAGRQVEAALLANDIPYIYIGGTKLLESAHIKDVMSVLRVIANPRDEIAWMRYLCLWPGVGEKTASRLVEQFSGAVSIGQIGEILEKNPKTTGECAGVINRGAVHGGNVRDLFSSTVQSMYGLLAKIYLQQDWDKRKTDYTLVEKLAENHESISGFIEEYILNPVHHSMILKGGKDDHVTLITIHSAKGTECKVCYVVNVSPGSYPSHYSIGNPDAIEEERRVLYVALTRAQDELIITRQIYNTWALNDSNESMTNNYFLGGVPEKLYRNTVITALSSAGFQGVVGASQLPEFGIDSR
jgi:DNA helicase-2/ATP-dependent DNA helicase PcrA